MAFGRGPLEGLVTVGVEFTTAFSGRRVLLTGHTGFKGAWLSHWLLSLGAELTGYALDPDTTPSLFADLALERSMDSRIGDIRDTASVAALVAEVRPEVVFHLAAQPLVRRSYVEPHYTFETNVIGTANVLEALRSADACVAFVNVTTDKVYANPETGEPFTEADPLGGHDPYSASKAASEILTAAYRDSFFTGPEMPAVATARAGNVIGGGDWAEDRLVPDCARALTRHEDIVVRSPDSVRPWQHVLEPLSGYLHLAAALIDDRSLAGAYNFGPHPESARSAGEVVESFVSAWGEGSWRAPEGGEHPHEAGQLRLDISKAQRVLGWRPVWGFDETITRAAAWYRAYDVGQDAATLVSADLSAYTTAALAAEAFGPGDRS
ncbi:MAG: CDP-glucose 4,6-dehydratase [Actinomycetota bacterium]|nr:CDP-glucose 4,6-dehydratase [Actinomycetota bacterium]